MTKISSITIKRMSPQFLVADINRSIDFYTKQLGFEVAFRYEDFPSPQSLSKGLCLAKDSAACYRYC
jgi:catechol 2,3-dioxygenase-like lactoylglutathione lyase family enzyme